MMFTTAITYVLTIVVAVKFVTCDADDVANKIGFRNNKIFNDSL